MKYEVVGYGSLISHKSLKETIKDREFRPVIVKGYRRVFDLIERGRDVLNVVPSRKSSFNGVLFLVDEAELRKVKLREPEYNLEKAQAFDFMSGRKVGKCLLFVDPLISIDHAKHLPQKRYFILCREAAYHVSEEFGKMWDKTTYLSDGQRVVNWIKKNPGYDTLRSKPVAQTIRFK